MKLKERGLKLKNKKQRGYKCTLYVRREKKKGKNKRLSVTIRSP